MSEIEVEESFETTTVRRKTVRKSIKIEEVSNLELIFHAHTFSSHFYCLE